MRSIRLRLLALFLVLSVVPLALLTYSSVHFASDAVRREVEARVSSSAALSAEAIREELRGLGELVESYARRPRVLALLSKPDRIDRSRLTDQLNELLAAREGIATTFVADPNGTLLAVVPATPSIVGQSFSYRDWYRGVTSTGGTYLSEAYRSLATGHPIVVAAATPVRARGAGPGQGRVLGILAAAYDLSAIQDFATRFAGSQGIDLTLTDQRGTLVASPGPRPTSLVSQRGDPLVAAALRGASSVTLRSGRQGRGLVAYQQIPGIGWTVEASVPEEMALAGVGRLRATVMAISTALALAMLIGLVILAQTLRARRQADEALRAAKEEAERANRAKSEFLSRMSHELRTPLNAILGFGQMLGMDPLDEDQRESVDQILKGGRHLLGLINEVLDISRIESGRMALSIEPVKVEEPVTEAMDLIRPLAAQRKVEVVADLGGVGYVLCDRQRIKQVLLNLLSNGVKYNREGGSVSLRCSMDDGTVVIEVGDDGPGIAPEDVARLFVPFERLGAERTVVEGTGLGLALSKRLLDAMEGRLMVESRPGVGTTFRIELPGVDMSEEPLGSVDAVASADLEETGERRTVLYIEDNAPNLRLVERLLATRSGYRLLSATRGSQGVDLARRLHPDLILLDVNLPDAAGADVLKELSNDVRTREIPVVVVSADATQDRVRTLLASGATDYLTKPIDVERLLHVMDDILSERRLDHAG